MSDGRWLELKARPIREVSARCGCKLGWALVEGIDKVEGRFLYGNQLFVVPCAAQTDHLVRMRSAHDRALDKDDQGPVDLEQILAEFERLTAGPVPLSEQQEVATVSDPR